MRAQALVILVLLVALPLAGCFSSTSAPAGPSAPSVSPALFGAIKKEQLEVPMKDGVKLDNWVYRPDAAGAFPVIIESRPYFGNLDPPASEEGQKFSKWLIHEFVPRGYVVVLHSVRGTGDSGGCYGQGGLVEQQDEADTVEAFAKQPYSTGKVAMIGKSYGGTTPWEAVMAHPAHLVTIVPIEGITSWYKYLYTNGATIDSQMGFDATYPATISFNGVGTPPPSQTQLMNYPSKVCQDTLTLQSSEAGSHATGDEDSWWQERDYEKQVAKINSANVSIYIAHGFQDWNVKPDHVDTIYDKLTVPKRLVYGQWDHQYPLRTDWGADLLLWFDHWLKGAENGIMQQPPVRLMDSAGVWHDASAFPPPDITPETVSVNFGDGASYVASAASEVNDPTPGPDKLVWKGQPQADGQHVTGDPEISFNATVDGPDTQFILALFDINGTTWTPVNWAALDARHTKGVESSQTLTPGDTVAVHVRFYPMDHALLPGHAWGIGLAGGGVYWTKNVAGAANAQDGATSARVTIVGGKATLTMPTLAKLTPESPQPTYAKPDALPWTS